MDYLKLKKCVILTLFLLHFLFKKYSKEYFDTINKVIFHSVYHNLI